MIEPHIIILQLHMSYQASIIYKSYQLFLMYLHSIQSNAQGCFWFEITPHHSNQSGHATACSVSIIIVVGIYLCLFVMDC